MVLIAKRLEGGKFAWPAMTDGVMKLSPAQLAPDPIEESLDGSFERGRRACHDCRIGAPAVVSGHAVPHQHLRHALDQSAAQHGLHGASLGLATLGELASGATLLPMGSVALCADRADRLGDNRPIADPVTMPADAALQNTDGIIGEGGARCLSW